MLLMIHLVIQRLQHIGHSQFIVWQALQAGVITMPPSIGQIFHRFLYSRFQEEVFSIIP
jgi:hypothetical protein